MRTDTFGAYVRAELDHWGYEFALHRDLNFLGHRSKNLLALLIESKGDFTSKPEGYRPAQSDERAQIIEDIVASIARDNAPMACSLRAYHCGAGRRKIERFETANMLISKCGERVVSLRHYLNLVELGFQRVRGRLEGMA